MTPTNMKSKTENRKSKIGPPSVPLPPLEMARLRQALYRFLGMLFLYPDETRLVKVRTAAGELLEADRLWETSDFALPLQRLLTALVGLSEEAAEQLEAAHNHLIRVKPVAPPYESFYLDSEGQARGLIVNQLEAEYASAGLALSPSLMDMPDHLAVELEFMSFLCGQEVRARETRNEADNIQIRTRQRAFLDQHLVKWFPQFARRVREAAPESLYSVIVEAAYAFLRHDLGFLGLRQNGTAGKV
jgi:TorA maturation chaperone TorD